MGKLLSELAQEFAKASGNYLQLIRLMARRIGETLGDYCSIRMIAAGGEWMELEGALFHRDAAIVDQIQARLREDGPQRATDGIIGQAITTGQAVLVPRVDLEALIAAQPRHRDKIRALQIHSLLTVPIRSEGTIIGVITVTRSAVDHPFDEADRELLEDLAAQASIAITSAKITTRLRVLSEASKAFAAATDEPDRLVDMVARLLAEHVGELCTLRLLRPDGRALESSGSVYHPDPEIVALARRTMLGDSRAESTTARAIETGQASIVVLDPTTHPNLPPQFREFVDRVKPTCNMTVPLVARGQVIGVVSLLRSQRDRPYTNDDLLLAQDLATHAALAIKNSRLIDDVRRTEEQLRQSQKMEAIGRLAGGVAHDFNNLLSVVLSYCTIISEELPEDSPLREDIDQIRGAGERAAELTKQLLAFGRQQMTEVSVVAIDQLVVDMERMLARIVGEDVQIRLAHGRSVGTVRADRNQLEQVIMNLAVNARDAMPHGGVLTIETDNVELDSSYARVHLGVSPGPHVMIAISDTGIGMDRETQARIFEPFFTTKVKGQGTGLGLSTVFGIVQQANGTIWVYSEPGKGTTFKVYLPRSDARADPQPKPSSAIGGSETILLVEDDLQVRTVAKMVLERAGYKLVVATDGADALAMCSEFPEHIDLLLTDVVMPGMSGRELAERVVERRPATRVLFMSGYTEDAILHHRVVDSGVALLQKPLTPSSLLAAVRMVLDRA